MKNCIILFFVILFFSCGDDGSNCPGNMLLPIKIVPIKTAYDIGDTIHISSTIPILLYDKKTDRKYDCSKYNFLPSIDFHSLDSTFEFNFLSHLDLFSDFIMLDSSMLLHVNSRSEEYLIGQYRKISNDSLGIQAKLVLNKKGKYWLKTESLTSGDSHLQNNYMFNCRGREITFNLEFSGDGNIELMQKFRSNERNNWILSDSVNRFYNYAGYCFEVR